MVVASVIGGSTGFVLGAVVTLAAFIFLPGKPDVIVGLIVLALVTCGLTLAGTVIGAVVGIVLNSLLKRVTANKTDLS